MVYRPTEATHFHFDPISHTTAPATTTFMAIERENTYIVLCVLCDNTVRHAAISMPSALFQSHILNAKPFTHCCYDAVISLAWHDGDHHLPVPTLRYRCLLSCKIEPDKGKDTQ